MGPGAEPLVAKSGYPVDDSLLSGLGARREYTASMISASRRLSEKYP